MTSHQKPQQQKALILLGFKDSDCCDLFSFFIEFDNLVHHQCTTESSKDEAIEMAFIEKRTTKDGKEMYRVQIRLKGYPAQFATFERKTDAKEWAMRTEAAIKEGRYFKTVESRKRTLEELIDKYIEERLPLRGEDKETVGPQLLWWREQIGKYLLSDVSPVMVAECRDKLLRAPMHKKGEKKERMLSNATVIRYLASLSVCFTYAIQDLGWIESNPIKEVRKPKAERGRVRFLSDEEREALLTACQATGTILHSVVIVALSTGTRMSEILNLTWKDIDFKRQVIRLEHTKNGERRSIPLVGRAHDLLLKQRKVRRIDTDYIFARKDGKKPLEIRKQWEKAVVKAGLTDFRFHDLRHTAASYLAMEGASLLEIADILGHKTMSMVKRYSHLTEQHTAGVLERMNSKQFAERENEYAG
jgi:integrase